MTLRSLRWTTTHGHGHGHGYGFIPGSPRLNHRVSQLWPCRQRYYHERDNARSIITGGSKNINGSSRANGRFGSRQRLSWERRSRFTTGAAPAHAECRSSSSTRNHAHAGRVRPTTNISNVNFPPFRPSSSLDPSLPHHDLASFQLHARRSGLSPTSTVYAGTRYEYLAQSTLRSYGFELCRVGGRGDRGVDLVGVWRVPSSRKGVPAESTLAKAEDQLNGDPQTTAQPGTEETLRVLVQCKRITGKHAKIGPNLIRELDGAVRGARHAALWNAGFPTQSSSAQTERQGDPDAAEEEGRSTSPSYIVSASTGDGTSLPDPSLPTTRGTASGAGPAIGVLVGTRPATKGVVESMRRSSRGLVWIMMEEEEGEFEDEESLPESRGEDDETHHPGDQGVKNRPVPRVNVDNATGGTDLEIDQSEHSGNDSSNSPISDRDTAPSHHPLLHAPSFKGRIKQILWNQAARDLGLEGIDVVNRYDSQGRDQVVLMRGGTVWGGS